MKKKFLIPVLGLTLVALVSFFSKNDTSEMEKLFIESDNIAFAESFSSTCFSKTNSICRFPPYGVDWSYTISVPNYVIYWQR